MGGFEMYKIRFNTRDFHSRRNRKRWEELLRNDFAVAINGKEFNCETELDLKKRLSFIAGHDIDNSPENRFELEDERYGKIALPYIMYGIPMGYIDIDEVIKQVNSERFIKIPFSSFYDLRQGNFFKGCYLEIISK